jgi:hypothetical protein
VENTCFSGRRISCDTYNWTTRSSKWISSSYINFLKFFRIFVLLKGQHCIWKDEIDFPYTVKPLYNEHQRDCPKSVHCRRCSLYRGFLLTERLCMYSAQWVWENEDDVIFVLELTQISTKFDSLFFSYM